ncbi:uncharacterized protein TNCV_4208491 [Trichonephila clavipes]|nr:uncharacterized protein TNCV_4208491 [Trichonephila clavipes]
MHITLAFRHVGGYTQRSMQGIHENCHPPTCDLFLTFKSFTTIAFALAKPISGQTQDNYYSKFAFAKPSAFSSEQRRGDYLSTGCGNAIRSRQPLNRVAISSDIRQAFLQICLADKHKDFVRFLWTDSNPRIGEKLTWQVYRFNRVIYIFGVNSSPFLLAATIKYHIEKYNEIHPITVQHLDSFMYVDDWITGQDTREEALFMSRHAKNIMKEAGMEMRKWISNDTVLMAQWAAEGFDTHPMDASIRLGTNKTKVLGKL